MRKGKKIIVIHKRKGIGEDLPSFIFVAQRHFEKCPPVVVGDTANLLVPTDLLNLDLPQALVNEVKELRVEYKR